MPKHRRLLPAALLIGTLLLISLLTPLFSPVPASAITVRRTIDTTLGDFSRGTFQRTALVDPGTVAPNANLDTIDGTVQLAQVGKLRELERASIYLNGSATLGPSRLATASTFSVGNAQPKTATMSKRLPTSGRGRSICAREPMGAFPAARH